MMKKSIFLFVLLAILVSACGGQAANALYEEEFYTASNELPAERALQIVGDEAGAVAIMPVPSVASEYDAVSGAPVQSNRLVLKNANISVVVTDPVAQMDAIMRMAEGMGGFIVTSNLYEVQVNNDSSVQNATVTIRVPSSQFSAALAQMEGSALEVQSKTISGQDVTQAYTDLQSRLRNLEDAADQLRAIMDQAYKTDEVLMVYNELTRVTEQAEVIRGQIQYYEEAAAFSAISVNLIAEATIQPVTTAGWQANGVAREALQALVNTLQGVVTFVIWLALYVLPSALLFGLPLLLLARLWKALTSRKPQPAAEGAD